jgi:DNA-binding NtrC family response regulator
LRERKEDIPLLFRKFAGDFAERYRSSAVQLDEGARQLLTSYGWPGNVRELKNIAEQISVLSKDKILSADQLSQFLPTPNNMSRLPALPGGAGMLTPSFDTHKNTHYGDTTEREILYKLFFDLKKDMNDLKKMMFELAQHQDFPLGNSAESFRQGFENTPADNTFNTPSITNFNGSKEHNKSNPLVIHHPGENVDSHEEVEESLSLVDREKEFIVKALQKHKGKRKDAAHELGISERTLYRKIKEYDIEE